MKKLRPTLRFFLLVLSIAAIAISAGASALTGEKSPKLEYRLSADWPKLPEGMKLGGISAVASDSKDNVYLLQRIKPHVLVFGSDGKFVRSWNGDFKTPHGLRIDKDDNLWIADMANHLVQKFSPDGVLLLKLGQKDKPGLAEDQFNKPADAAVAKNGDIYVADGYGNSRVAQFDKTGKFLRDWGKKGKGPSEFNIPHVVVLDDQERVIVGDRENARVQIFDRQGKLLSQWKDTGAPYGLYLHKDRVYLADGKSGVIRILDKDGKLLTRWDAGDAKNAPHWLSVDRFGTIYVGFVSGSKVEKWVVKS
jgi:DNA-binding beta-propeller fold protein YncE